MKRFYTYVLSVLICQFSLAQGSFTFAKNIGGFPASIITPKSSAIDSLNNLYVTGYFYDTVDFDPSSTNRFLHSSDPGVNSFVAKYDSNGQLLWSNNLGTSMANALAIDKFGNTYLTGYFSGTMDFDPSPTIDSLTSNGAMDVFVVKYDSQGALVWAKNIGGQDTDVGDAIAVSSNGEVYLTGTFTYVADFDPGQGVFQRVSHGLFDVFIVKLDANGDFAWAESLAYTDISAGRFIALTKTEDVITMGWFSGTADFDPSAAYFPLTAPAPNSHTFIWRLDSAGNFVYAKQIESAVGFMSMHLDQNDNIITSGEFRGTVDFNPSTAVYNLHSQATDKSDLFICKLNSQGDFIWAKGIGNGLYNQHSRSLSIDKMGNIFTTGSYSGTVDFDPHPINTFNLSSTLENPTLSSEDIFALKLDSMGNFGWAVGMGSELTDLGQIIHADDSGNIFTIGTFEATTDFDPDSSTYFLTPTGAKNMFIHKMNDSQSGHLSSVGANQDDIPLKIYPNPVLNQLTISSELEIDEVSIFTMGGEIVLRENRHSFPVNTLPNGQYIIVIRNSEGQIWQGKFLKQ